MQQITFLFWNMNKNASKQLINMVKAYNVDVILLCDLPPRRVDFLPQLFNEQLNKEQNHTFYENYTLLDTYRRMSVFSKFDKTRFKEVDRHQFTQSKSWPSSQLAYFELVLPNKLESISLILAHLCSKKNKNKEELLTNAKSVVGEILKFEERIGHERTIVVGDFNANPFDEMMYRHDCFNATMSSKTAEKKFLEIKGAGKFPYFYNPAWGLLGDLQKNVPATFYFTPFTNGVLQDQINRNHHYFGWNMLDFVLLRADMIPYFEKSSFKILENDGTDSASWVQFIEEKTNKENHPDQLPIIFKLTF